MGASIWEVRYQLNCAIDELETAAEDCYSRQITFEDRWKLFFGTSERENILARKEESKKASAHFEYCAGVLRAKVDALFSHLNLLDKRLEARLRQGARETFYSSGSFFESIDSQNKRTIPFARNYLNRILDELEQSGMNELP